MSRFNNWLKRNIVDDDPEQKEVDKAKIASALDPFSADQARAKAEQVIKARELEAAERKRREALEAEQNLPKLLLQAQEVIERHADNGETSAIVNLTCSTSSVEACISELRKRGFLSNFSSMQLPGKVSIYVSWK